MQQEATNHGIGGGGGYLIAISRCYLYFNKQTHHNSRTTSKNALKRLKCKFVINISNSFLLLGKKAPSNNHATTIIMD
jgi:hypothetical protein